MGFVETLVLGALAYLALKRVIEPTIRFRQTYRRKLDEYEKEQDSE